MDIKNREQLENKLLEMICQIIGNNVEPETIKRSSDLSEDGLNSLGMIKLVLGLESEFHVQMSEELLVRSNFQTIQSIADCLAPKLEIQ